MRRGRVALCAARRALHAQTCMHAGRQRQLPSTCPARAAKVPPKHGRTCGPPERRTSHMRLPLPAPHRMLTQAAHRLPQQTNRRIGAEHRGTERTATVQTGLEAERVPPEIKPCMHPPMSRPSCSSPRACTSKLSPPDPSTASTRSDTLVSASAARRSPILVPVSWVPSRPARGEVFGEKIMDRVGGSMWPGGRGGGREFGLGVVVVGLGWAGQRVSGVPCCIVQMLCS